MRRTWVLIGVAAASAIVGATLGRPCAARAEDPPAAAAPVPAYVGPETCKKCHLKQYKAWKATGMAKGFEALKPNEAAEKKTAAKLDPAADYTKDVKCLKCHTTGYGTASGYPARVEGKEWTPEEQERATKLEGTTCEACHGPGSLFAPFKKDHEQFKLEEIQKLGATSPPKAEQCLACHVKECPTMGETYAFDFEKAKVSKDVHEHLPLKFKH